MNRTELRNLRVGAPVVNGMTGAEGRIAGAGEAHGLEVLLVAIGPGPVEVWQLPDAHYDRTLDRLPYVDVTVEATGVHPVTGRLTPVLMTVPARTYGELHRVVLATLKAAQLEPEFDDGPADPKEPVPYRIDASGAKVWTL